MSSTAKGLSIAILLAAGAFMQIGCRACYTPYDYCGPVAGCGGPDCGCDTSCGSGCGTGCCGSGSCGTGGRSGSVLSHFAEATPVPQADQPMVAEAPPEPAAPILK